jgi:hypothetical protein
MKPVHPVTRYLSLLPEGLLLRMKKGSVGYRGAQEVRKRLPVILLFPANLRQVMRTVAKAVPDLLQMALVKLDLLIPVTVGHRMAIDNRTQAGGPGACQGGDG